MADDNPNFDAEIAAGNIPQDPEDAAIMDDIVNGPPPMRVAYHTWTAPAEDVAAANPDPTIHGGTREEVEARDERLSHGFRRAQRHLIHAHARYDADERVLFDRFAEPPAEGLGRPDQMIRDHPPIMINDDLGLAGDNLEHAWGEPDFPRIAYPEELLHRHYQPHIFDAIVGAGTDITGGHFLTVEEAEQDAPPALRRDLIVLAREGRIGIREIGRFLFWGGRDPDVVPFHRVVFDDNINALYDDGLGRVVGLHFGGGQAAQRWRELYGVYRQAFDRALPEQHLLYPDGYVNGNRRAHRIAMRDVALHARGRGWQPADVPLFVGQAMDQLPPDNNQIFGMLGAAHGVASWF